MIKKMIIISGASNSYSNNYKIMLIMMPFVAKFYIFLMQKKDRFFYFYRFTSDASFY